ncbi:ATP-binding protein [Streptomyces sp. NPDC054962]
MSSERARLTALYGLLLVLAGLLLVGVVYVLVRDSLHGSITDAVSTAVPSVPNSPYEVEAPIQQLSEDVSAAAEEAALNRLLTISGLALAVYSVLSAGVAWWIAGRVLRPVRLITAQARRISAANLHERLDLAGPPGELKNLADTFDGMLDRIEELVAARQRFAANAAHELRTSMAVQRVAADIGLAHDPDPDTIAQIRRRLVDNADASEHLIEGLLLLAVSEQGLQRRRPVAVDEVALRVAEAVQPEADEHEVTVTTGVGSLTVPGDAALLHHLLHNLLTNAVRYNHPGGTVHLQVGSSGITVTNTGPELSPDIVPLLFEPFRRAQARTHAQGEGAGLGLSIAASIAHAHGGHIKATPRPGGGLCLRLRFAPAGAR